MTNIFPSVIKSAVRYLYRHNQKKGLIMLTDRIRKRSIIADWALSQGMYITGTPNAYLFYKELSKHTLENICDRIHQDVLLLAGEKDHYITNNQYYQLKNQIHKAKTLTCRLFTKSEGGEQHCQIGNHLLAVDAIINWLDLVFCEQKE
jgi:hypothetical protein